MSAKLSPDLVREVEQAGGQPLTLENPVNKRVYVLVDTEEFDVVRRRKASAGETNWTQAKNERRCELIRKKFSRGLDIAETDELANLQDELSNFRKRSVTLPYDSIDVLEAAVGGSSPTQ